MPDPSCLYVYLSYKDQLIFLETSLIEKLTKNCFKITICAICEPRFVKRNFICNTFIIMLYIFDLYKLRLILHNALNNYHQLKKQTSINWN